MERFLTIFEVDGNKKVEVFTAERDRDAIKLCEEKYNSNKVEIISCKRMENNKLLSYYG